MERVGQTSLLAEKGLQVIQSSAFGGSIVLSATLGSVGNSGEIISVTLPPALAMDNSIARMPFCVFGGI